MFKNSFFSSAIIEWNKLDSNLRKYNSYVFKIITLKLICRFSNSFFDSHNSIGIQYMKRFRLSHLREHKFKHSFLDSIIMLNLPYISSSTVLISLVNTDHKMLDNANFSLAQTLLFSNTAFNTKNNKNNQLDHWLCSVN